MGERLDPDLGALLALHSHIGLRGRIFAHQNSRQAGCRTSRAFEIAHTLLNARANFGCNDFAVDNFCRQFTNLVSPITAARRGRNPPPDLK